MVTLVDASESNRECPQTQEQKAKGTKKAIEGAPNVRASADERQSREVEFVNLSRYAKKEDHH